MELIINEQAHIETYLFLYLQLYVLNHELHIVHCVDICEVG